MVGIFSRSGTICQRSFTFTTLSQITPFDHNHTSKEFTFLPCTMSVGRAAFVMEVTSDIISDTISNPDERLLLCPLLAGQC